MKLKTAKEVLKKWEFYQHMENNSDMIKAMKEYAIQFVQYASENLEPNYEIVSDNDTFISDVNNCIAVYISKEEFDKIKKLII